MEYIFQSYPEVNTQQQVPTGLDYFIKYINFLKGVKGRVDNLHWAAKRLPINDRIGAHVYLDRLADDLSDFQDAIAEDAQGILGFMEVDSINSISIKASTPLDLLKILIDGTIKFYEGLPSGTIYAGIKSETETFIHKLNVYKYLFGVVE